MQIQHLEVLIFVHTDWERENFNGVTSDTNFLEMFSNLSDHHVTHTQVLYKSLVSKQKY